MNLDTDLPSARLLGQTEAGLVEVPSLGCWVQPALIAPLLSLAEAAAQAGFQLAVASSFRSFDRQLAIWNAKARGQRPVLDDFGQPMDLLALSEADRVKAILRWSTLPGGSRHHWGTDLDVYDASALPDGYALQLTTAECEGEGPFNRFHCWLSERIALGESQGFYRPYAQDFGGIAPEPWHLSFAPLALGYQQLFSADLLADALRGVDLELKDTVLALLPELVSRFMQPPIPVDLKALANAADAAARA